MKEKRMEGYLENEKFIEDGISYPFRTHTQAIEGRKLIVGSHYHDHIEILFCLSGRINIFLDGQGYVFGVGDMVVINSMEVHNIFAASEGVNKYIVIRFDPELLYTTTQSVFESRYVLPFTMKTSVHQKLFTYEETANTPIPDLIKKILLEDQKRAYGFELAIRTYIGEVFLWILRSWQEKGLDLNLTQALDKTNIERLQKVFDYVDEHFDQEISIQDMAKLCAVSYSYFSRFFKSAMNRNFSAYVNFIRISKAESLLTTSELSVTDIALNVGFSTTSYFIEQFKLYKNMTPKRFRNNFQTLEQI
ncbi:MAG: AraC family transcriptional regulator [Firmicutes bacterium HGW-Firmicutes-5]|nr:MAG: AraC family transcriptional regulator [Firmicutes bacterium HGW-Firmicutes-5]